MRLNVHCSVQDPGLQKPHKQVPTYSHRESVAPSSHRRLQSTADAAQPQVPCSNAAPGGSHQPLRSLTAPIARTTGRRILLLSVAPAGLAADLVAGVGSSIKTEIGLWQQEIDLYSRQLKEQVQQVLGAEEEDSARSSTPPISRPALDSELAEALLQAPMQAIQQLSDEGAISWDVSRYQSDYDALYSRELPYFKKAGLCGHCGDPNGDPTDAGWFDFRSYVQWKAIRQQLKPGPGDSTAVSGMEMLHSSMPNFNAAASSSGDLPPPPASPIALVKARMGELLLARAAKALGEDELGTLLTQPSSDFDWIRQGVRVLLSYYETAGYMSFSGIAFFGASKNEPRNHQVWSEIGEPAYVKVWLRSPAGLTAARALRAEEGFAPDFLTVTLSAFLNACGVRASRFRTFPSYVDEALEAEQFTVQRADLASPPTLTPAQAAVLKRLPMFRLDACPSDDEATNCY